MRRYSSSVGRRSTSSSQYVPLSIAGSGLYLSMIRSYESVITWFLSGLCIKQAFEEFVVLETSENVRD